MRFKNLFDWVYLKIAVGKDTCNPHIRSKLGGAGGTFAERPTSAWHCD
jgi:hypothetical protein